ncbi:MAG: putative cytosol aminopeptidase [Alphaproteobacteria bacterium MarineAlpha10_Bin3]|nr:MAG: putative cytosol aminopeptidase [Alphaproteobacteria bacterium MarineAlpha10_Bin3]PPR68416.1 MAG: putative cytosol aminopeptidase [Alphaproteobacteria bacterium MarineAlpha4_Bin1]
MTDCFVVRANARTIMLTPLEARHFDAWLKDRPDDVRAWVRAADFSATPGAVLLLPGGKHGVAGALIGVTGDDDIWSWSAASAKLPAGRYRLAREPKAATADKLVLGWGLAAYQFTRYRDSSFIHPKLVWPRKADRNAADAVLGATFLARDLINTPASDMGPAELAGAARKLAREFKAKFRVIVGDDLLKQNFPAIHAVGRASSRAPRLIDFTWGRARDPKLTLVGKGVCFDTGGLDLKPASGMLRMKKDMGGAAIVLGLARMVMMAGMRVRLRVLIPAVENAVSSNAYRPLDVITTRKGIKIEIGNTDAEGRVVLSDALALAVEEDPDLVLDFATLTGAARVALGPSLPAMFTNQDKLAAAFARHGAATDDPVWRLPLWRPYRKLIESTVADIVNTGSMPLGGAITAALFLEAFVEDAIDWAHFDIMAWNLSSMPGRPEGGEAMAMRAAFAVLAERYSG